MVAAPAAAAIPRRRLPMTPAIETSRLILRLLQLADAEEIQILFPQWEIVRFLNNRVPWPYPPDGALTFSKEEALPAMERGVRWHWTLRLKSVPGKLIGGISLMTDQEDNRGFWLGLPWHGQGLMSEACGAVTDFWFDELKFPVLRTSKPIANSASRRISEKQGMRVVATSERDYVSGRHPSETWEITAEEWHTYKARAGE